MQKKIWVSLLSLLFPLHILAQSAPEIRTGRPGQSIGPYVVGQNYFQVQSGLDISESRAINATDTMTSLLNNIVRVGVSESFELSAVLNVQDDQFTAPSSSSDQSGVSSAQLGFRNNIIDTPDGFIPALGIQTRFQMTTVSNSYRSENMAPMVTIASQHQVSLWASLVVNIGLNYDGVSPIGQHFYTLSYSQSFDPLWGGFIEFYGNEKAGLKKNYVDGGLSYLASKDLQLDLSCGWGRNIGIEEKFVSIGVSWRIKVL